MQEKVRKSFFVFLQEDRVCSSTDGLLEITSHVKVEDRVQVALDFRRSRRPGIVMHTDAVWLIRVGWTDLHERDG